MIPDTTNQAPTPSYRTWLQDRYYNSSDPTVRQQASALLGVVGDDGKLDANFVQASNNQATTGKYTSGQYQGYGADGMTRINTAMLDAYQSPNRVYGAGTDNGVLGNTAYTNTSNAATSNAAAAQATAADLAYLNDQQARLDKQMGYIDKTEQDGYTKINDEYDKAVSSANTSQGRAMQDFETKRTDTTNDQGKALGRIDTNAMTLADSLRRRLGMASGANSSAYKFAAPNAVAREATQDRTGVMEDYSTNWRNLDTSQGRVKEDYAKLLEGLGTNKSDRTRDFKAEMLGKRNEIDTSRAEVGRQRALAQGGGYNQVRSAMSPYSAAIDSRDSEINGLFDKYRTPFTVKEVDVKTPDLKQYMVDRTAVNANKAQGYSDYGQYLRKPEDEEEKLY